MRRHCHNSTGAVTHHDIIRNVNRDFLAVDRIDGNESVDSDPRLVFDQLRPLKLGFFRTFFLVSIQSIHVADRRTVLFDNRMFRRDDHEGNAEQSVRACGIDAQRILCTFERKVHKCAAGFADPVDLLLLDIGGIVNGFEPLKQFVRIFRDPQIPDVLRFLNNIGMADITLTALTVFV